MTRRQFIKFAAGVAAAFVAGQQPASGILRGAGGIDHGAAPLTFAELVRQAEERHLLACSKMLEANIWKADRRVMDEIYPPFSGLAVNVEALEKLERLEGSRERG